MKIGMYIDGQFGEDKSFTLPSPGGSTTIEFAIGTRQLLLVGITHVGRIIHPTGPTDEYISGEEGVYRVVVTGGLGLDYDHTSEAITRDIYEYPEGSPRPDTPTRSLTVTQDFIADSFNITLRSFLIKSIYVEPSGWYRQADDDSNLILSVYLRTHEYTLRYDSNGGQGAPQPQTFEYAAGLTLSIIRPSRRFYEFIGWDESSSAHVATFQPGQRINSMPARDMTLYAVWRATFTFLPMRPAAGGNVLLRSPRNGLIIRHGDP